MKPKPSPDCCYCDQPHGRPLRWVFESCDACDAERDQRMIDASAVLTTASCPRCDLLFSVDARPALTDEEREAVEAAASIIDAHEDEMDGFPSGSAATLRKLLERTK